MNMQRGVNPDLSSYNAAVRTNNAPTTIETEEAKPTLPSNVGTLPTVNNTGFTAIEGKTIYAGTGITSNQPHGAVVKVAQPMKTTVAKKK